MCEDVPDDVLSDPMILMAKNIPHAAHPFPRDLWLVRQQLFRQVPACFGQDLDCPFDSHPKEPIGSQILNRLAIGRRLQLGDCLQHFIQNNGHVPRHQKIRSAEAMM